MKREQRLDKLRKLADSEGFGSSEEMCEFAVCDSVSPGICTAENCDYTAEVEPDCEDGFCEGCDGPTMQSALVLAGLI